jgi:Putative peptidoglycan binding domain
MMDGVDIIAVATPHLGERYHLGARAPLTNPAHKGPWDCAEFASWCAYRTYGIVFGCFGQNPATADPYSGKWFDDAVAAGTLTSVSSALGTAGAFLLRKPGDFNIGIGHVAISLGDGRTVEARSAQYGVLVAGGASHRPWTTGAHLPGVRYASGAQPPHAPPSDVLQLMNPYMRGDVVKLVQYALVRKGFALESIDGIYGPESAAAVSNFQAEAGLVVDGEVGPESATRLGVGWPIDLSLLPTFEGQ